MRITGRQLRQIIKEEVERMMNEEDGVSAEETILVGPDGKVISDPNLTVYYTSFARDMRRRGTVPVVIPPDLSAVIDTAPFRRVADQLLAGQVFNDRNATTDVKLVVNTLLGALAKSNPKAAGAFGAPAMPTEPFGRRLKKAQEFIMIKPADGILGLQTYFGLISGGAIDIPSDALKQYAPALKDMNNKIIGAEGSSFAKFAERLKNLPLGTLGIGKEKPVFGQVVDPAAGKFDPVTGEPLGMLPLGVRSTGR
jgi:hypothetical protein